jgi:hypothetical protein
MSTVREPCSQAEKKRVFELRISTFLTLASSFIAGSAKVILVAGFILLALAGATLARPQVIVLFVTSRSLLAKIILVLACTTHVSVEVVISHSVICHFQFLPPHCAMVNCR